jgi:hypothetical protein
MERIITGSLRPAPTITTKAVHIFEVTFGLDYFVQTYGPLDKTYTWEIKEEDGQRHVISGLKPTVNDDPRGATVSFSARF